MKYFEKDWYFYLKIIPWDSFWEILINSVKANLNAFWKNWIWFWIDIYVFKKNKNIYTEQYIYSNKLEWISFIINFFEKLYDKKVSFSLKVNEKLIDYNFKNTFQIWQRNHGVLQIKKMWSLWGEDFLSSSSLHNGIIEDYSNFINENDVILISFSFTKWDYSFFVKDYLYAKYSKGMDDEEKQSFLKSFTESQNFFKFRYFIKTNFNNTSVLENIIEKNLRLYDSLYNNYSYIKKKWIFDFVVDYKRIIQPEAILSQWLFLPISKFTKKQINPIITPSVELIDSGFIKKF